MTYTPKQPVHSKHEPADFGFTSVELEDAKRKYGIHRAQARSRGLAMELAFDEWMWIWIDSGHWYERGTRRGQYVMSRYGDKGNYALGNVHIQTAAANSAEAEVKVDLQAIHADPEVKRKKSEARKKHLATLKADGANPFKPSPCTVDGVNIYPSRAALICALGTGTDGTRNPNYRRSTLQPNKPDIRKVPNDPPTRNGHSRPVPAP